MEVREMTRKATTLLAGLLAAGTASVLLAGPAPARPLTKVFPAGCWIGSRTYSGTSTFGGAKARVTNGKVKFVLWVGKGGAGAHAVGYITVTGHGSGTLAVAGSELAMEVKILGDYDLSGSASAVKVNGTYSMKGVAVGTGQFGGSYPVDIKWPLKNVALKVTTLTARHATGVFFQKTPWTASKRGAAAGKSAAACANAS
jgi:hypothetical protein